MTDMDSAPARLRCLADLDEASAILHPLRVQLLVATRQAQTSGELAESLGMSRQKVGYHLRELEKQGLVRSMLPSTDSSKHAEKRYVATATHFLLDPTLLGELAPQVESSPADPVGPDHLLAMSARLQAELHAVMRQTTSGRPSALAVAVDALLDTPVARTAFVQSVLTALKAAAAEHAAPAGSDGRTYRVLVGCYPIPDTSDSSTPETS